MKWLVRWLAVLVVAGVSPSSRIYADDWPQWLGPQRDGVWREDGIVEKLPSTGLKVRWKMPIGSGYSGPAVVGKRVFVTDRKINAGADPGSPFQRGQVPSIERVLCLDDESGKILWQYSYPCVYTVSYPAGPRCTPTVDGDRVYALGAEGHLTCLAVDSGKVLWSQDLKEKYGLKISPTWGFASHPLIDGDKLLLFVGGANSAVVALDKTTGRELWRALSATGGHGPGYGPPMIYQVGSTRQLVAWLPDGVNALDPETGKVLWSHPFSSKEGLTAPTPRLSGDRLFLTSFYDGPCLLKLDQQQPGATELWRGKGKSERLTDGLHSIMPTPFIVDGHIYGVCSYGQLRCVKVETGERVWEDLTATGADKARNARWANAFLVAHRDRFFIANEQGDLLISKLTPQGYQELSRAPLIKPTGNAGGRAIVWSHPAFAHRHVYARNDEEIVSVSLAE